LGIKRELITKHHSVIVQYELCSQVAKYVPKKPQYNFPLTLVCIRWIFKHLSR